MVAPVHLTEWLGGEIADLRTRLLDQVLRPVPPLRRLERPGDGSSIAWSQWHIARHADLALHAVLRHQEPLLKVWEPQVGSDRLAPGCGLEEAEDVIAIAQLDPTAVADYLAAVLDSAESWLMDLDTDVLDGGADGRAALQQTGVSVDAYAWLYRLWSDRDAAFFLRWEVVGHIGNHIGEMIATRDRMGLSPFRT